jgi:hypothetical protein
VLNNESITPAAPGGGFANTNDLRDWCNSNWGAYGVFTKGKDVLVLQAGDDYVTGKLSVTAL